MSRFSTLQHPSTANDQEQDDNEDKINELLAAMGQTLSAGTQKTKPSGATFTTEKMRMLKCRPNKGFAFNELHGGETKQFHGHENGRVNFPMDGLGATRGNPLNKNCDEYGGVPFYLHQGKHCHRGVK